MSKRSLDPQHVSDDTWFYEGKRGITVVHEARDKSGAYIQTDQFLIPWPKLDASLRRHKSSRVKKRK